MPWPKTGTTYYNAQLGLLDKDRAFKRLVVCNSCDVSTFGPAKRFDLKLILTFPLGTNRIKKLSLMFLCQWEQWECFDHQTGATNKHEHIAKVLIL